MGMSGGAQCKILSAMNSYAIHSEARGPHWIAWVSRDGSGKPDRSIILIGASQAEAEANARRWAEQTGY